MREFVERSTVGWERTIVERKAKREKRTSGWVVNFILGEAQGRVARGLNA